MSADKQQPQLRAIAGSPPAQVEAPSGVPRHPQGTLVIAAARPANLGTQLVLPTMDVNPSSLILACVSELERSDLGTELRRFGVRHLLDLRLGPVYRPFHLEPKGFFALLASLGIRYAHLDTLADRYIGDAWHEERYRQRLEAHYAKQVEAVRELRRSIDDGPVMLILAGYSALAQGLLLHALERVAPGFECLQLRA